jgi:hypothetical protein
MRATRSRSALSVTLETSNGTNEARISRRLAAGEPKTAALGTVTCDRDRIDYTIIINSGGDVDECDEDNNEYEDTDHCD